MHRLGEIDAAHQHGLELGTQVVDGSHIVASSLGAVGGAEGPAATGSAGTGQARKSSQAMSADSEHLATHKRIMDDIKVGRPATPDCQRDC